VSVPFLTRGSCSAALADGGGATGPSEMGDKAGWLPGRRSVAFLVARSMGALSWAGGAGDALVLWLAARAAGLLMGKREEAEARSSYTATISAERL
jgi:hypothetical protein